MGNLKTEADSRTVLYVKDLEKIYGKGENLQKALDGVSFQADRGEFIVLLGPSGSGKTTLLNILGGVDTADSGSVSIAGDQLEKMKEKKLTEYRRKHLGYIFQTYNLIGNLTVRENIEVGAYLSDSPLDLAELLETLGLEKHKNKVPDQLSGGQQQRTAIGRALIKKPDLLLCDEPTGALDSHTSREILRLIETVNQKYGTTVLMVTHNEEIAGMADHILRMKDGKIVEDSFNKEKVSADGLNL